MFCQQCGNTISDNSTSCPFCGYTIPQTQQQNQQQQPMEYQQVPYTPTNPQNPDINRNPYYNQQQNFYAQPQQMFYGTPGYNSMQMYAEYNKKATDMRTSGILAAVLMFGIGLIFSIMIWSGKSHIVEPPIPPQNMHEQALLEDGRKKLNTANILSFLPLVGIVIGFIIGFVGAM